jgi:hypothetical protein
MRPPIGQAEGVHGIALAPVSSYGRGLPRTRRERYRRSGREHFSATLSHREFLLVGEWQTLNSGFKAPLNAQRELNTYVKSATPSSTNANSRS